MKFDIQRETIFKSLQQVIGVVERRQTLPVLSNVLLVADEEGLSLTATDLEVELSARTSAQIEVPGEITLHARKFLDICRALPEEAALSIALEGDRVTVRSGRSRFTLATLPASEFPVVEGVQAAQTFSLAQRDLRELIEHTHFSMAQQDVRYYLNGLLLEISDGQLTAVATDGHRLALCELAGKIQSPGVQQVIVPRKGIHELLRLLDDSEVQAQVDVGTNHIRVTMPGIRFTSKLIDGRFPDYKRVLPKTGDKELVADREALRQALTRASILSNEKYRGVRLQMKDGVLRVQAHNPEQEEAEEEVEVQYRGGALEIGFNVTYLLDVLAAVPGATIQATFTDPNSSCLIWEAGSERCKYVVMPMRL